MENMFPNFCVFLEKINLRINNDWYKLINYFTKQIKIVAFLVKTYNASVRKLLRDKVGEIP